MTLSIKQTEEFTLYGKLLTGAESDLDLKKLMRIQYLKQKMRKMLEAEIGDTPDNLTDAIRAIVLGEGIRMGLVTSSTAIAKHEQYISALLEGYGGADTIADVLISNLTPIYQRIVEEYFVAKYNILIADNEDEINKIDIDEQPDLADI